MPLRLISIFIIAFALLVACGKTDPDKTIKQNTDPVPNCRILTISSQNNVTQMIYDTSGKNTGYKTTDTVYNLLLRKYTFSFNSSGQLVELPPYNSSELQNFFVYNSDGTISKILYFNGGNSSGYDLFVYNSSKQPITYLKYSQNSTKPNDSIAIQYDSRGNVIKTIEGLNSVLQDSVIYQYDSKNNYLINLSYNYIIQRQDFIYWGANNVTKKIRYNGVSGKIENTTDYVYVYNSKNFPVSLIIGGAANTQRRFTYDCK